MTFIDLVTLCFSEDKYDREALEKIILDYENYLEYALTCIKAEQCAAQFFQAGNNANEFLEVVYNSAKAYIDETQRHIDQVRNQYFYVGKIKDHGESDLCCSTTILSVFFQEKSLFESIMHDNEKAQSLRTCVFELFSEQGWSDGRAIYGRLPWIAQRVSAIQKFHRDAKDYEATKLIATPEILAIDIKQLTGALAYRKLYLNKQPTQKLIFSDQKKQFIGYLAMEELFVISATVLAQMEHRDEMKRDLALIASEGATNVGKIGARHFLCNAICGKLGLYLPKHHDKDFIDQMKKKIAAMTLNGESSWLKDIKSIYAGHAGFFNASSSVFSKKRHPLGMVFCLQDRRKHSGASSQTLNDEEYYSPFLPI